jgi:FAD/FMN-containing dehydrogenase
MKRRTLLRALPALPLIHAASAAAAIAGTTKSSPGGARATWPSSSQWEALAQRVDGRLFAVRSPFADCASRNSAACNDLFRHLRNPYFIRDEPALTQTLGWVDAWRCAPSLWAVAPTRAAHVAAAVDFARRHRVRLAIKGGGHSYQGTSNASDSLLIWTRGLDDIVLHDAFVPRGCAGATPLPAVSVGAGAIWMHVYEAVSSRVGRYVQGGGCTTVGVAGHVQSGGFGSFSKRFGTSSSNLLEAEVVTADGRVRIVNACRHTDLYFALRGGGGGTFGVVTRVTMRTHELPPTFGAVFATIQASSNAAFRTLIARFLAFYRDRLLDPHWGEIVSLLPQNRLRVAMVFQGLDERQARQAWQPFVDTIRTTDGLTMREPFTTPVMPARNFWNPAYLRQHVPNAIVADDRTGASPSDVYWSGDAGQVGQYLHGYTSTWLPGALLAERDVRRLADALFAASRHWPVGLHFNKGLAGAPQDVIEAAAQTAMNPVALHAFALAIIAADGPPAHPGIPGHAPDLARARADARRVRDATLTLRSVVPDAGTYVSESDYFEADWGRACWGDRHARLRAIKSRYDPHRLFNVHHGVGSEAAN